MKRVCKDCGKEFTISDSEIDFYKKKNLELPKRCSECRSKNKLRNKQSHATGNINENNIKNNKSIDNTKKETNPNNSNETAVNTTNNSNKNNNNNTFRNVIIAAVVVIASFFGLNLNSYFSDAPKNDNKSAIEQNVQSSDNNGDKTSSKQNNTIINNDDESALKQTITFRNEKLLSEHFEKHRNEFNYNTKEEYVNGALAVINSSSSKQKTEAEDGDKIYYDEEKNEIVFVSKDGYIRTYFKPTDGINYFNRQ